MTIRLFHNPRSSASRNALALLRERGVEPEVVDYLKTGWGARIGGPVEWVLEVLQAEA